MVKKPSGKKPGNRTNSRKKPGIEKSVTAQQRIIDSLRARLGRLRPTGVRGFEGLAARLVGAHLGVTLRLAKAGDQRGRDAGAGPVALECKRYEDTALQGRMLAGNLTAAIHSAYPPEIWVLAATRDIPLQDVQHLQKIGRQQREERKVKVVILDWEESVFPRFLALMIAHRQVAQDWFAKVYNARIARDIDARLAALSGLKAARKAVGELRKFKLRGDATERLKAEVDKAYENAFKDAVAAKTIFGQRLPLLANEHWLVERTALLSKIDELFDESGDGIAVLGDEGVGKTWAIVDYWRRNKDRYFLIFVSSQQMAAARYSNEKNVLVKAVVNTLETRPHPSPDDYDVEQVEALLNANTTAKHKVPFLIVLDGLNERPDAEWGSVIHSEAKRLGKQAQIVVTCRPLSWKRNFSGGGGGNLDLRFKFAEVGPFSSEELDIALRKRGIDPAEIDPEMVGDLNNPRLLNLAAALIGELAGQPITREKVFWEYWRRQREDHSGKHLNEEQFNQVLTEHATRSWDLVKQQTDPKRQTFVFRHLAENANFPEQPELLRELETVATTGFFQPASVGGDQRYALAPDRLYYAMGLTLFMALADHYAEHRSATATEQYLAEWIDPLIDTDAAATILSAALLISCYHDNARVDLTEPLLSQLLSLRNRQGNSSARPRLQVLAACSILFPEAVVAGAEKATDVDAWMVESLSRGLSHDQSGTTIRSAIQRWLTEQRRPLASLALQVIAGHDLSAFAMALQQLGMAYDPAIGAELYWLLELDEATPDPVRMARQEQRFGRETDADGAASDEGVRREVPSSLMHPRQSSREAVLNASHQPAEDARKLLGFESNLFGAPPSKRLARLKKAIRELQPSEISNLDRSFVLDPEGIDIEQVLVWAKRDRPLAAKALRLWARVEPAVSEAAADELVDFILDDELDESARVDACRLVLSSEPRKPPRRLFASGWSATTEQSGQVALTASAILSELASEPGSYAAVRDRIVASALLDAVETVSDSDSGAFIFDLDRLVMARLAQLTTPATPAPAVASGIPSDRADAENRPEFLASLSPAASIRLVKLAPAAVERWIKRYEREMLTASLNTEIRSFVISLLPGWSVDKRPDAAIALQRMVRELSQSVLDAGRESAFTFVDFKSAIAMAGAAFAASDPMDRAIGAMIRSASDDQTLFMIVHYAHELGRESWLQAFCDCERATARPGRLARARMLEAMAGFPSKPLAASAYADTLHTEAGALSIETDRARALDAFDQWKAFPARRAGLEKLLIEAAMRSGIEIDDLEGDGGRMLTRRLEAANTARSAVISDLFLNRSPPPLRFIVANAMQTL
jgi:hypothetical protein